MECEHRSWLLRRYKLHVRSFSDASGKLAAIGPLIAKDEWMLAWKLTNRARKACEESLSHLKSHIRSHGCGLDPEFAGIDFSEPEE